MAMSNHDPFPAHPGTGIDDAPTVDLGVPPFLQHHGIARALVETLLAALGEQTAQRGALTREEFARTVERTMEHWPLTLPLFARVCRGCPSGRLAPADPVTLEMPAGSDEGQRRDFVTRLMYAAMTRTVPEAADPVTGNVFPRVIVPGLQANLSALFYDKEWEAMNADARAVFHLAGAGREEEVWARASCHPTLPVLTHALFVRVMLRFKQFAFQRQSFIRRMAGAVDPRTFAFADGHFDQIFEALFGHLRDEVRTELGRARMDVRYGDETSGHLLRIFDAFDTLRRQRAVPVRTMGGAVKPPATVALGRRR